MKSILMSLFLGLSLAHGQNTAFTYQGRLNNNGSPFTGSAEFQPTLWDAASNGNQIAVNSPAQLIVPVTNGLFTLPLDFGANFPGANRWVQLEVRTTLEPFALLSPRQPLTPTPYAITASNLSGTLSAGQLSGALASSQLTGTYLNPVTFSNAGNIFAGNGVGLTGVNADLLEGLNSTAFWKIAGNPATTPGTHFLGTTDNQPLEMKVNGGRALRLEPGLAGVVNIVGGSASNIVAAGMSGATIGGGHANSIGSNSLFASVSGGYSNQISASSPNSLIAGGFANLLVGTNNVIGGGVSNIIQGGANRSGIASGQGNLIDFGGLSGTGLIGGGTGNKVFGRQSMIAGGVGNYIGSNLVEAVIVGGCNNKIYESHSASVIVGGWINEIGKDVTNQLAQYGFIGGGSYNVIRRGVYSVIVGGDTNSIAGNYSTLVGGEQNTINGNYASLSGGRLNSIGTNASYATIPGGYLNSAASYAFAAGRQAKATNQGAFVWADSQAADFGSTANNQFLVRASGGVGINKNNPATALDVNGTVTASTFTGSGSGLTNLSGAALAAGSVSNAALSGTLISNTFWRLGGNSGTTPGTHFVGTTDNQALEFKVNGVTALSLQPNGTSPNVVGGNNHNVAGSGNNFVGSGQSHAIVDPSGFSAIAGGSHNLIGGNPGPLSVIAFGGYNFIGGGLQNFIETNAAFCAIAGGQHNSILTNADWSTVGGGYNNDIGTDAQYATIPGGRNNVANGNYSFASGRRAKANHAGAFVWADSQDADFASTAINQFLIRAAGGVGIGTTLPYEKLHVRDDLSGGLTFPIKVANESPAVLGTAVGILFQADDGPDRGKGALIYKTDTTWNRGAFHFLQNSAGDDTRAGTNNAVMTILNNGNVGIGNTSPTNKLHVNGGVSATAFVNTSDRNAKENFSPIDSREVLDKVVSLPITRWNFKELKDGSHVGPMAQDFYAAFGLGSGETTITTLDADGVALAAIQGLNQKLDEKETRIGALEKELLELRQAVKELSEKRN